MAMQGYSRLGTALANNASTRTLGKLRCHSICKVLTSLPMSCGSAARPAPLLYGERARIDPSKARVLWHIEQWYEWPLQVSRTNLNFNPKMPLAAVFVAT